MKTILIVDDLAIVREPLAASLELAGYRTACASDGTEALALVKRVTPDLILLDLAMPGVNGLGFLRSIRSDPALGDVPIIVLTADASRQRVIETAGLGVCEYLLKTQFSLDKLVARLKAHLGEPVRSAKTESEAVRATAITAGASEGVMAHSAASLGDSGLHNVVHPLAESSAAQPVRFSAPVPAESIRSIRPVVNRTQITEVIDDCGELKAMSPTVMQILKLTGSASCSIDQVVRAIKQDHAIALKVLKLANSTIYTRGEPVENVQKAVMRIGLKQIRQAVLNLSVVEQFSSEQLQGPIDTLQFWEHSIACGLICSELARATGAKDEEIDAFFTMGLLHDVGRLVYADKLGDQYAQVIRTAAESELPLEQVESRMLLVDHAAAMDRVLRRWTFPKELIDPIAFHHSSVEEIHRMTRRSAPQAMALALANRLSHALLLGSSGNPVVYPTEQFCEAMKLDPSVLCEIQQRIPGQTDDMKLAMISRGTAGGWPQMARVLQEQFEQPFCPIHVSRQPDLDAYRILTERLRSMQGEAAPNIAVVHFHSAADRAPLTAALLTAEKQAGVATLPAVLLSPDGKLQLEDRAMAGRRYILLSIPVYVPQFIRAVNRLLM